MGKIIKRFVEKELEIMDLETGEIAIYRLYDDFSSSYDLNGERVWDDLWIKTSDSLTKEQAKKLKKLKAFLCKKEYKED